MTTTMTIYWVKNIYTIQQNTEPLSEVSNDNGLQRRHGKWSAHSCLITRLWDIKITNKPSKMWRSSNIWQIQYQTSIIFTKKLRMRWICEITATNLYWLLCLPISYLNIKRLKHTKKSFTCYFIWVWNLVPQGKTHIDGALEWVVKENL
jgi:hypothetical protein